MTGKETRLLGAMALTIIAITAVATPFVEAQDQIMIEYFHKPMCKNCGQYINSEGFDELIRNLKNEYGNRIYVDWLDVTEEKILERLIAYNITLTPAVVFEGEHRLVRGEITKESLRETVDAILGGREETIEEGGLAAVSASVIFVSGLVDGINPCAFSLLVFFLSFLTGLHRSRRSVLGMGAAYIVGLYVVYLGLGLGLLKAISFLGVEHPIGKIGAALLVFLGLANIRDALSWEAPILKFPRPATPTVRRLVSKGALPAALALGGFVSLCEFACSGGVYVGILVLLTTKARYLEGVAYLLLYNLVFVAPLVLILLLGTRAENLARIDRWRILNRRQMKATAGLFMILLGAATYYCAFV